MKFLTSIIFFVIAYSLGYFVVKGIQSTWNQSQNPKNTALQTSPINQLVSPTPTSTYCGSILRTAVQYSDVTVPDRTPLSDCLYAAKNRFIGAQNLECDTENKEKLCNLPTGTYQKLWNNLLDEECSCWNENPLTYPSPTPTVIQRHPSTVFICYDPNVGQAVPCIHPAQGVCMDTVNGQAFPCVDTNIQ